jgi:signal transduction histidine kinase/PAS domain-containing protein
MPGDLAAPRLLASLLDYAPLGVAYVDAGPHLVYGNRTFLAAVQAAGYSAAQPWDELLESARQVMGGSGLVGEVELAPKAARAVDGRTHLAQVYSMLDSDGAVGAGVILVDAADRTDLRESEQRFRAFMDNGPVLSAIVDNDDRAVFFSAPTLRALGVGSEAMGRRADELLPPADAAQFQPLITQARASGNVQTAVLQLPVAGVGPRDFQSQYFPLPGTPSGMVGVISLDVTDVLATQRRLADAAGEEAALRRVATLVAAEADDTTVFAVATEEVGRLLAAQTSNMVRFTDGLDALVVGAWHVPGVASVPTGLTVRMDGDTALTRVFRSGTPARVDSYDEVSGELAARLRALGLHASVAAPIVLQGRLWGAFTASTTKDVPMPAGAEQRMGHFTELVAQALANSEARRELAASRERVVEAADSERRALERDLHDGAQQRLVALLLALRATQRRVVADDDVATQLALAVSEAELAVQELRELAHGIHPAVLINAGLPKAVRRMAAKAAVPVTVSVDLPERLPGHVEAALYFICSESLANAQKHSRDLGNVTIALSQHAQRIVLEISDDGPGGAVIRAGGGLEGLRDRMAALGGQFTLTSPPGAGTTIRVTLSAPSR